MARTQRRHRYGLGALGYSAGDIIGNNVDPGWSGPAMKILSIGSGNPVHWNTGGSANITLPALTRLEPIPATGWIFILGSDGYLTYERGSSGPVSPPVNESPSSAAPPPITMTIESWDPPAPPNQPVTIDRGPIMTAVNDPDTGSEGIIKGDGAEGGIPVWVWILGGAALLYFLSERK